VREKEEVMMASRGEGESEGERREEETSSQKEG